jgi:hypothetical protein
MGKRLTREQITATSVVWSSYNKKMVEAVEKTALEEQEQAETVRCRKKRKSTNFYLSHSVGYFGRDLGNIAAGERVIDPSASTRPKRN